MTMLYADATPFNSSVTDLITILINHIEIALNDHSKKNFLEIGDFVDLMLDLRILATALAEQVAP